MAAPDVPQPMDVQWHDVMPDGFKDTYVPDDALTFTLFAGNGRAIVPGTLLLEGRLEVTVNGFAGATDLKDRPNMAFLDQQLGVHSLIAGTDTAIESRGQVENIGAYARAVRMVTDGTRSVYDVSTKSDLAALRFPTAPCSIAYLQGPTVKDTGQNPNADQPVGTFNDLVSFSFAPHICINKASGPVSFARTGHIRTTFRLGRAAGVFYGPGVNHAGFSYRITGLRMRYNTVPVSNAPASVACRTMMTSEHTLATNTSSITAVFPSAAVDSFTLSFRSQAALSTPADNAFVTERVAGLNSLVISLNDAINGPITKPVRDEQEALRLGRMSLGSSPLTSQSQGRLAAGDGWLLGYPLGRPMDVSRVPFTVVMSAEGISNNDPFLMTVLAHATVPLYGQAQQM
jgi:hypothetical protein